MIENRDKAINYIEFAVKDMAQTKAFYQTVFGWQYTDYGPGYCEFNDGQMKGGFEVADTVQPGGALVVLYGTDLEALQQAVADAGGTITRTVFSFPGGERFQFQDPNGHELAVWRTVDAA